MSFHPSGNYLLSASSDNSLKIFDLIEGRPFYTLHGHKAPVLDAAFSPSGEFFASGGADEQVLVWKTNFDTINYQEVLKGQRKRSAPAQHHGHDPSSGEAPHELDMDRAPKDHTLIPPPVVNIGPQPFHRRHSEEHGSPSFPEQPHSGEVSPSDQEKSSTVPLGEMTMSPQLANTLEHIVSQLDILTETVSILEQRLTMAENKLRECLDNQQKITLQIQPSE